MTMTMDAIRLMEIPELPILTPIQTALLQTGTKILDESNVLQYQNAQYERLNKEIADKIKALPPWPTAIKEYSQLNRLRELLEWRRYAYMGCRNGMTQRLCGPRGDGSFFAGQPGPDAIWATGVGWITVHPEAVAIAERLAATGVEALFQVEQLDEDPFLVIGSAAYNSPVSTLREKYYIAVWDEANFIPR